MDPNRKRRRFSALLQAGAAAFVLSWATQGHADAPPHTDVNGLLRPDKTKKNDYPKLAPGETGADGLKNGETFMSADQITRNDSEQVTIGKGSVVLRKNGATLLADEIIRNELTNHVKAIGHVIMIHPDGSMEFGEEMNVDDAMEVGATLKYATTQPDQTKVAGAAVIRRSQTTKEFYKSIFTPCIICTPSGKSVTPTWDIKADSATEDEDKHVVYYRNAVIELFGVPVLPAPILWHPDPEGDRASGLLASNFWHSEKRGLSFDLPYLWVVDKSTDVIINPIFSQNVEPFLGLEVDHDFYSGDAKFRLGMTQEQSFNSQGVFSGNDTFRGFIKSNGQFKIDQDWNWGFVFDRTFTGDGSNDQTITDRYDIPKAFDQNGIYATQQRRWISELYLQREAGRSYFSITAFDFQTLAIGENQGAIPFIAPLVEFRYQPDDDLFGGTLRLNGSAVSVFRNLAADQLDTATIDHADKGPDTSRITFDGEWRRIFTLPIGLRIEPFIGLRDDAYYVLNKEQVNTSTVSTSYAMDRAIGVAGIDLRYPFIRYDSGATYLIEPLFQISAANRVKASSRLPNEDSLAFEFDDTTLMRPNRAEGFDLYDGGDKINVGMHGEIKLSDGRQFDAIVGRSFQDQVDPIFLTTQNGITYDPTGLYKKASDWILYTSANPIKQISFWSRFRLDGDTYDLHTGEVGSSWTISQTSYGQNSVNIRWITDHTDPTQPGNVAYDSLSIGFNVRPFVHWGMWGTVTRDMKDNYWVQSQASVFYANDCFRVDVTYHRNDTNVLGTHPDTGILVRFTLAILGTPGYTNPANR